VGQVGAGLLVGASGLLGSRDVEVLRMMGDLGITLLLFLVGLEMNIREIKHTGKAVIKLFLRTGNAKRVLFLEFPARTLAQL